mmetsp:Transcript_49498/g.115537  ORF Transcript_49498/g.115537 Transcript_49498/m.115537 type:complete len:125 (+) Transcript_49498:278-652(+)
MLWWSSEIMAYGPCRISTFLASFQSCLQAIRGGPRCTTEGRQEDMPMVTFSRSGKSEKSLVYAGLGKELTTKTASLSGLKAILTRSQYIVDYFFGMCQHFLADSTREILYIGPVTLGASLMAIV